MNAMLTQIKKEYDRKLVLAGNLNVTNVLSQWHVILARCGTGPASGLAASLFARRFSPRIAHRT